MSPSVSVAPRRVSKLEAGMRLGINRDVLNNLIKAGQLELVEIPGMRPFILESSLDQFIERMKKPAQKRAV